MEKKSTKIAYFVALGIFVVLLAILGITFKDAPIIVEDATTPFAGTFWSLLPPIVAIVLALISKEVYSSLFLGCLVGALLVSNFHPWNTLVQLVEGDNGGDDTVVAFDQLHQRLPRMVVTDQQSADQTAQEQGGIHFLTDQGQYDGHDGGQQGP